MRTRKELKGSAKHVLKKHYLLLVFLCMITMLFSSESLFSTTSTDSTGDTSSEVISLPGVAGTVFNDYINNNWTSGQDTANQAMDSYQNETDSTGQVLGHTQGVFAGIANNILSGKLVVKIGQSLLSVFKSQDVVSVIMIYGSLLLYFLLWMFFINTYEVISDRMFLEARTYEKVPMQHMIHLMSVKRWGKAARTMLLKYLYSVLWDLTIVGGFIKYYSYRMVPYIIAENPDMKPNQAITLSRKMMNGHKWEAFKLDLSFFGWFMLSLVTGGIAGILFLQPYQTAVFSEYYNDLRTLAKENHIPGAEMMNDEFLFAKADHETLEIAYSDIVEQQKIIDANEVTLTGARKFFVENFSIWLGDVKEKRSYQKEESLKYQTAKDREAVAAEQYPSRLSPLYNPKHKHLAGSIFFLRSYTIWSLILMFFLFAFVGWLWEVSLYLIKSGVFVNRGTMLGPWLPIYGSGGIVCLVLMSRFRKKPVAAFAGSMVLCAILEYSSSYFLQANYGQRWWDYTGYFLNLNGRICAEGILVFGIGCMIVIYLVAPINDMIFSHISEKILIPIALVLSLIFCVDAVHSAGHPNSGSGITDDAPTACVIEEVHPL